MKEKRKLKYNIKE